MGKHRSQVQLIVVDAESGFVLLNVKMVETMADYINREELIKNLKKFAPEHYSALVNTLIEKQPAADVVSIGVHQQVRWERDTAIEQLEEYGVCFGEKKKDLVEVKHGNWLIIENPNSLSVICSNCKENYYVFKKGQYRIEQSNHCPNCGAKMEGGIHLEK